MHQWLLYKQTHRLPHRDSRYLPPRRNRAHHIEFELSIRRTSLPPLCGIVNRQIDQITLSRQPYSSDTLHVLGY